MTSRAPADLSEVVEHPPDGRGHGGRHGHVRAAGVEAGLVSDVLDVHLEGAGL